MSTLYKQQHYKQNAASLIDFFIFCAFVEIVDWVLCSILRSKVSSSNVDLLLIHMFLIPSLAQVLTNPIEYLSFKDYLRFQYLSLAYFSDSAPPCS